MAIVQKAWKIIRDRSGKSTEEEQKKKSGKSGDEEPEAEKYIFGDKMVALDGVFESRT